jgi:hypothetical protein
MAYQRWTLLHFFAVKRVARDFQTEFGSIVMLTICLLIPTLLVLVLPLSTWLPPFKARAEFTLCSSA